MTAAHAIIDNVADVLHSCVSLLLATLWPKIDESRWTVLMKPEEVS